MNSKNNPKQTPHIAIITFPMASHSSTLFTVAKTLARSAPLATFSFICSPQAYSSLEHASRSSSLQNLKLCQGLKVEGENYGLFFANMPNNLRDGIDIAVEQEGLNISCIVSDGLMPVVGEVAREMGVSWVPVRFCGPAMVLSHFYHEELNQAYVEEEKEKYVSVCPSLSVLRFKDIPDFILAGKDTPLNTGSSEEYPQATAVVLNTFEGLDPLIDIEFKSKFKKYLPIGPTNLVTPPPLLSQDDKCMSWLDCHATGTVVYISFGTFNSLPKKELVQLANALEESDVSFLWSLKENDRKELPAEFLDGIDEKKGLMVDWAPQVHVLGHRAVGAFLTHGGWNSVMESMASGVPMICRPFRWDQMTNARMVSDVYKIGVTIEAGMFVKEEIGKMLRIVLVEEEGRMMRHKAVVLKDMAELAVGPGGSSTENLKSLVDIIYERI